MPVELTPSPNPEHYTADNQVVRQTFETVVAGLAPADKDIVAAEIKQRVIDATDIAEEAAAAAAALAAVTDQQVETIPPTEVSNAKTARGAVIQLFHVIRLADRGEIPRGSLNIIPPRSRNLLRVLDRQLDNKLSDSSAVIIFPLITKVINNELSAEELEREFNNIKSRLHPTTAKKIRDAILERHNDYGLSEDEAKSRFEVDESLRDMSVVRRGPRNETERGQYEQLLRDVDCYPSGADVSPDERAIKQGELWSAINRNSVDEAYNLLRSHGWTREKVEQLVHLTHTQSHMADERLRDYAITSDDIAVFDARYVEASFDNFFEVIDGRWVPKPEFKGKLIEAVYRSTNKITARVGANPDAEWRDNFSDFREGAAVSVLRSRIYSLLDNESLQRRLVDDNSRRQFRDMVIEAAAEIDYEVGIREALHTVRKAILGGQAGTEDLTKFLRGRFPSSRWFYIMRAYDGELVTIARDQSVRFVDNKLQDNGNIIPAALFASFFTENDRYIQPDQRQLRDDFVATLQKMRASLGARTEANGVLYDQLNKPMEQWRVDRAMALGMALSLVADMRIPELLATADPNPGFEGGMAGGIMQEIGRAARIMRNRDLFEFPSVLHSRIPMTKKQREARRNARHHNPLGMKMAYFPKGGSSGRIEHDELEYTISDREARLGVPFHNMLRDYVSFGFLSKRSWRLGALKAWYKDKHKGESLGGTPKAWRETYDNLVAEVGAGICWEFDEARVSDEIKHVFLSRKWGADYADRYTDAEQEAAFREFYDSRQDIPENTKEHGFSGRFLIFGGQSMTIDEFKVEKVRCYQGMNFERLLGRSPLDFLLIMSRLEKEIVTTKGVKRVKDGREFDATISAYEFYFGNRDGIKLTKAQEKDRSKYLEKLEKRWGKDNTKRVGRVMQFWHEAYGFYQDEFRGTYRAQHGGQEPSEAEMVANFKKSVSRARARTYHVLGSAAEIVKKTNKRQMTREDIVSEDPTDEENFFVAVCLDGDGLQEYFHGLGEKYADGEGKEDHLGDKKFFYTLAVRWFDIDQRKLLPSTNEVKLEPLFDKVAVVGEDLVSRQWGDPPVYNEVVKSISIFDQFLRAEARGDVKGMEEFMGKITALASNEGNEGMWKLAFGVLLPRLEFFQRTGHAIIDPFWNPRYASDSKVMIGPYAADYVTEQLRLMTYDFEKKGWLPHDGPFSGESLRKILRIDTTTYFLS